MDGKIELQSTDKEMIPARCVIHAHAHVFRRMTRCYYRSWKYSRSSRYSKCLMVAVCM